MLTADDMEGPSGNGTGGPPPIVEAFNGWLAVLVERDGSDLHLKVGQPPKIR